MKIWFRMLFLLSIFVGGYAWAGSYPLPADQAFVLSVPSISSNGINLHWQIAPGYHLYKDRISVGVDKSAAVQIGKLDLPVGTIATDEPSGPTQEYQGQLSVNVPISGASSTPVILLVNYQGCQDNGICYPPIAKQISFNLAQGSTAQISAQSVMAAANNSNSDSVSSTTTPNSSNTAPDQMMIFGFPVKSFVIGLGVVALILLLVIRRSSPKQKPF